MIEWLNKVLRRICNISAILRRIIRGQFLINLFMSIFREIKKKNGMKIDI